MDRIDKLILSRLSAAFPLAPQPYAILGAELGVSAAEVLARVQAFRDSGEIRRIGGTVDPRRIGWYSTLCAANVPEDKLADYARVVNAYREVTHNYVRAGQPNGWFTIIAPNKQRADQIITEIRSALAIVIEELPAGRIFKIGVRFSLADEDTTSS